MKWLYQEMIKVLVCDMSEMKKKKKKKTGWRKGVVKKKKKRNV